MKNKKIRHYLFKPLDLVLYFNIFMFLLAPFLAKDTPATLSVFMVIIGLFNLGYLIVTIRLRYELYQNFIKDIEKESRLEENAQKEGNNAFINLKQEMLENRVFAELKNELPNAKFIRNAYIPKHNNQYAEIDILMVDTSGIYIFEIKNLAGRITGHWSSDDKLNIEHPGGSTYSFYNPIKQNTNHFKYLREVSGLETKLFRSIIVLGDHTIFSFDTVPSYARVCQIKRLLLNVEKAASLNPVVIESHQVDQIYETLNKYLDKTDLKAKAHIQHIQEQKATQES